ncbi:hypothetical protein NDN08_001135 [Rhodosorus marinus]|uniref:F-box domain-containing protein n=1 Tax=Rhodosorus marinus TaxID=101924 RepID=A0AAV8UU18_9RHOD|nr:hypothetical protein NDN08_001135 [Rhodosorus marinus]
MESVVVDYNIRLDTYLCWNKLHRTRTTPDISTQKSHPCPMLCGAKQLNQNPLRARLLTLSMRSGKDATSSSIDYYISLDVYLRWNELNRTGANIDFHDRSLIVPRSSAYFDTVLSSQQNPLKQILNWQSADDLKVRTSIVGWRCSNKLHHVGTNFVQAGVKTTTLETKYLMETKFVDDRSPANGANHMDRSETSENVVVLPELPPEIMTIIVRYSGVGSMLNLAQVNESFRLTVQKWADERTQLRFGHFLRGMDETPSQELVLSVLRLFKNLVGLSFDYWKWTNSFPDICSFVMENYTSEYLKSFDVKGHPISATDIRNLAMRCPNITHLGLQCCGFVDDAFLCYELPKLWPHSLSSVDISDCPNVTDTGLRTLFGLVSSVRANGIRRIGRNLHLASRRAPILEGVVHMSGWHSVVSMRVESPRAVEFKLSAHRLLERVTVIGHAATSIDLHDCSSLQQVELRCPNLTSLSLAGCKRLSAQSDIIGLAECKKLKFLNLKCAGMRSLNVTHSSLEALVVTGCNTLVQCRLELPQLKLLKLPQKLPVDQEVEYTIVCTPDTKIQACDRFWRWHRYTIDGMLHISSMLVNP